MTYNYNKNSKEKILVTPPLIGLNKGEYVAFGGGLATVVVGGAYACVSSSMLKPSPRHKSFINSLIYIIIPNV